MAGQASGGQTLTPNRNVTAVAGVGGDQWGANGGGIAPIGGGVSGQTGWDASVKALQSDGETAANYQQSPIPVTVKGAPTQAVLSLQANAALRGTSFDDVLAAGGSNQG